MSAKRTPGRPSEVRLYDSPYRYPPIPLSYTYTPPKKTYSPFDAEDDMDHDYIEKKSSPSYTIHDSPYSQADTFVSKTMVRDRANSAGSGAPPPTYPPYAEHGPTIDRSPTAEAKSQPQYHPELMWPRMRHALREPLSEFMGTFILIMFGDGVVAQVTLSENAAGDYQSISWGWGLGVMLGVYASGISGAHLNPAVTFANCVFRKMPWRKFPVYMVAQVLGAMAAAFVVYGNYKSAITQFEGGPDIRTVPGYSNTSTAGIFCTYPQPFMTTTGQFFSEFVASTLLMFLIYALKDDGNLGAGNLTPLGLFFIIFGIGACFGWETGYAINLARDFGPRLVSYMLGYGTNVWRAGNWYFWVPMVSPFCGCTFGGFLYDLLLFTGESPINTPYLGLWRLWPGWRNWDWEKEYRKKDGMTKDVEA
ncbi:putative major intrinsic protein 2 [Elsinoe fawcettii]|nr:putative major intrinsic protein 2 [Elsinoe fawcettii]